LTIILYDFGGPLHFPRATKENLDGQGPVGLGRGSVGWLRADIVRKNRDILTKEGVGLFKKK
jgi:hypothetical protein